MKCARREVGDVCVYTLDSSPSTFSGGAASAIANRRPKAVVPLPARFFYLAPNSAIQHDCPRRRKRTFTQSLPWNECLALEQVFKDCE